MNASIAGQLIAQVEDLHFKLFRFPLSKAKLLLEVGHPEGKAVSLLAHVHELFWVADPVEHADQEEELARRFRFMSHRGQTLALQFVVGIRVGADEGLQVPTGVHLHQAPLRWQLIRRDEPLGSHVVAPVTDAARMPVGLGLVSQEVRARDLALDQDSSIQGRVPHARVSVAYGIRDLTAPASTALVNGDCAAVASARKRPFEPAHSELAHV